MKICVGIYLKALMLCKKKSIRDWEVIHTVMEPVWGDDSNFTSTQTSLIKYCKQILQGYTTITREHVQNCKWEELQSRIWDAIYSVLDPEKLDLFLYALRDIELRDPSLRSGHLVSLCNDKLLDWSQLDFCKRPEEYTACLLLYAALYTNNGDGAQFNEEINEDYLNRFRKTVPMSPVASSIINGMMVEESHLTEILDNLAFQGLSGRMGRHKLMSLANKGNPFACFEIGEMYYHGYIRSNDDNALGRTSDLKEAYRWYKKAVEIGNHPGAWWTIGYMRKENFYPHVDPSEIDYGEVLRCFQAAGEESPAALNSIGELWESGHYPMGDFSTTGRCYPADSEQAHVFYKRAASKGYHYAANHLGRWYEKVGDYISSYSWYKQSIEMVEDSYAYNKLGLFHEQGLGCKCDIALACSYFLKSINRVLPDDITPWAQFNAGRVYTGNVSGYATGYYDLTKAWQLFVSAMKGLETKNHDQVLIAMLNTLLRESMFIELHLVESLYAQTVLWIESYMRSMKNIINSEIRVSEVRNLWLQFDRVFKGLKNNEKEQRNDYFDKTK